MNNVVIGLLGTQLDANPKRGWLPTVSLCLHPNFAVARLEILYDGKFLRLAEQVKSALAHAAPDTETVLRRLDLDDPWDFEEVYGKLFDFARGYGFDEERERYHLHLTTGTHVAQICWFLLAESRHIPAKLLQTGPPRGKDSPNGTLDVIDLDLSRYNALQQRFDAVAGESAAFLKGGVETRNARFNALIERIEHVATRSDAPILLLGETGVGKTSLAERIFELKRRTRRLRGKLVAVNCASLRGEDGLATLFGRKRGGGSPERRGLLREADGGALFLDELDQLGLEEQAALLSAVETGRFLPLGSDSEAVSRFQVIGGARPDLARRAAAGAFRADLFARLNLWTFELPTLGRRREDIEPNIDFELSRMEGLLGAKIGFNADAREAYLRFALSPEALWSGGFRDLAASAQRMATLAVRGRVTRAIVEEELATLRALWSGAEPESDRAYLAGVLGDAAAEALDLFDVAQLAAVIRVCRVAKSLSAAGRALFAASREKKASGNDADRLRKYLARFGLDFAALAE